MRKESQALTADGNKTRRLLLFIGEVGEKGRVLDQGGVGQAPRR